MSQWNQAPTRMQGPPRTESVTELRDYVAKLADIVAIIAKDLDFIINGNIDANNIRADSITAQKISVDELSAISANLGKITAGEIYGNHIATSETAYPRIEMRSTGDLLAAYKDETNLAALSPDLTGNPTFLLETGSVVTTTLSRIGNDTYLYALSHNLVLRSNNDVRIRPDGRIVVQNWATLFSEDENQTLAQALGI